MKKNNINSNAASAANLVQATGFEEFMDGVKNYKIGAQFSIPDALGSNLANVKARGGSLVTLGKLVRNNVENGNLQGLEPLQTLEGTAKKYKVIGNVKMKRYFSANWEKKYDDPSSSIKIAQNELFVFCTFENHRDTQDVHLTVTIKKYNCKAEKREICKKLGDCGFDNIESGNLEFPAIQAIWYGFDRVAEMNMNQQLDNIDHVYIIGTNEQMMRRIAGCHFSVGDSKYNYTEYIQSNFFQFLEGELREIPLKVSLAAFDDKQLKKYIEKL